jgi:hypothetical protein
MPLNCGGRKHRARRGGDAGGKRLAPTGSMG